MCDLESLKDFLENFKKASDELENLLNLQKNSENSKISDSKHSLETALKKKINKKRKKLGNPKLSKLCGNLISDIERMNLEDTIKNLNTLKTAFPKASFNRLLIDLFTYSVLLYGHEQEFIESFINLNDFVSDCSSNLQEIKENTDFMSIKETISDSITQINDFLSNKSLKSDDLPNEIQTIKKRLKKIKNQLNTSPIIPESQIQKAFDGQLKKYMDEVQKQHENEIEKMKQKMEQAEAKYLALKDEKDRIKNDFIEIENYNINLYQELQELRAKNKANSGNSKLMKVLILSNRSLQEDLKNSTLLYDKLNEQAENISNELAQQLESLKSENSDLHNQLETKTQEIKLTNERLEVVTKEYDKVFKEYSTFKNNHKDVKDIEIRIEEKIAKLAEIKAENEELKGQLAALQKQPSKQNLSRKASSCIVNPNGDGPFGNSIMEKIVHLQDLTVRSMGDQQAQHLYIAEQLAKQLEIKRLRDQVNNLTKENAQLNAEVENVRRLGFVDPESLKEPSDSPHKSLDVQAMQMKYESQMSRLHQTNKIYLNMLKQVKHKLNILHQEYVSMHSYIADEFNSSQDKKMSLYQNIPQLLEKMKSLSFQNILNDFN